MTLPIPRRRSLAPAAAAWLTAAVGGINVLSALTPELPARAAVVGRALPEELIVTAHAFVLPAGLALLALARFLARGHRRALHVAVGLLLALTALEVAKGLDVEEAALSGALAGALLASRSGFRVRAAHGRADRLAALAGLVVGGAMVVAQQLWHGAGIDLLWVPAVVAVGAAVFRPLRDRARGSAEERAVVSGLVRRYGDDTLSAFKLRGDLRTFVASGGEACVGYRVERGVLLVAGDPVGAPAALPGLLEELRDHAAERGLRLGAVAASAAFAELVRPLGLRALYLGDEALVAPGRLSLEGRANRKLRQAVGRVQRAGYVVGLERLGDLDEAALVELEALQHASRRGEEERGFSMAMDGLRGEHLADSLVAVARDAEGAARGMLHLVPTYGRPAVSLSLMCRGPQTPNGLVEHLVVAAVEALGERGIEEVSLNFAAFARWMDDPQGRLQRVLGAVLLRLDGYYQLESLRRFNAKFSPRWQERYLLFEGVGAFAATGIAALAAEGWLPTPSRLRRAGVAVPADASA